MSRKVKQMSFLGIDVIRSLIKGLPLFGRRRKGVICLMYHNVFPQETEGIISKEEFERHMKYIAEMNTFKMEELEGLNYSLPENSVIVTFDDGYMNNYTYAFPILRKYNIKATVFLNTGYVGKDEDYLGWEEIREMYVSGLVDFQLHTHTHSPIIRKSEIKGFYKEDEAVFIRREHFHIFKDSLPEKERIGNFRDFDFKGLPVFKIRSQISIRGLRLREGFMKEYRAISGEESFSKMSEKEKKVFLNKLFRKRRDELFIEVSEKEHKEKMVYEITYNKRIIEEKLGKKAEYLAYPWGHKYKGDIRDLKKLGVKGFLTTKEKVNSANIDIERICRINADKLKEYNLFVRMMNSVYNKGKQ